MSNKSTVIAKNTPQAANQATPTKSNGSIWLYVGGAAVILISILMLVSIFKGESPQKSSEKLKQEVPSTESAANGARPVKNNSTQKQDLGSMPVNDGMQQNNATGQNGNVAELRIYKDAATNVEMVQTPSGPVPTASIEGQKYIEDFTRLKQESSGGTQSAGGSAQAQVESANLTALTEATNYQVQALDEKINSMYETNENLQEVIKKQNETIEKMALQIKSIQPLVKSPRELAQEYFGKDGQKVLQSRNRQIKVDSVLGDKAFFTDKNNTVYVLRVGDVVPNTSQKVIKIDEATQAVIVAY